MFFFCVVTQNVSWILRLPQSSNLVPDSAKSKVIVNSDIFGSTVEVNTIFEVSRTSHILHFINICDEFSKYFTELGQSVDGSNGMR